MIISTNYYVNLVFHELFLNRANKNRVDLATRFSIWRRLAYSLMALSTFMVTPAPIVELKEIFFI
jgi:hypothetical protein